MRSSKFFVHTEEKAGFVVGEVGVVAVGCVWVRDWVTAGVEVLGVGTSWFM